MEGGPKIVVVGSCNTDLIAYMPRMPKAGETLRGDKFQSGFGGKGANQCVAAARLGAQTAMVSRVGDDAFGKSTLLNFEEQKVDARHVEVTKGAGSGVALITVDKKGTNSIVIVPGANDLMTPEDVEKARSIIRGAFCVVCQLEVPLAVTLKALQVAREEGVMTIMNPAPAPDDWMSLTPNMEDVGTLYELSDYFVPNETELENLTGMSVRTLDDVEQGAKWLLRGFGLGAFGKHPKKVVVTLGSRGCMLVDDLDRPGVHVPLRHSLLEAVDTTGAGDCFIGAMAYFLGAGYETVSALDRANCVASESVLRRGTQTSYPTREMLPDYVFDRP